jgi:hypothetical protein
MFRLGELVLYRCTSAGQRYDHYCYDYKSHMRTFSNNDNTNMIIVKRYVVSLTLATVFLGITLEALVGKTGTNVPLSPFYSVRSCP